MPKVGHRLREWAHFKALMKNPDQCKAWVKSALLPRLNAALKKFHDNAAAKNQGTIATDWMFGDIKPSHFRLVLQNPHDIDNQAETPFTIELIDFGASHRRKKLETKVEEIREDSGAEAYSLAAWLRLCDETYKDTSSQEGFDSQKDSSSDDAGPKAGPSGVGRSGHSSPQPGAEVQPATQGETVHPDDHSDPPRAATATPPGAHDDGTHGSEGSCNCCKTQ
ncbi:hypothetical protein FRB91_001168 [Serendipita sp. 411]|nr:hypothetical protein FRB91_001168 [Serendipita sp. 411]KAG9052290.1 hypothetical protein FS842_010183 [Serendipita sp. 407]